MTDTIPTERSEWKTFAIGAAIIASAIATVVIATLMSTPPAPIPTQTVAEQTFLRLIGADTHTAEGQKTALWLGHDACRSMKSTQDYAAYRTAVGNLMAAQEPPAYAQLLVHSALTSGLCAEQQ